jgi:hypothetical protein
LKIILILFLIQNVLLAAPREIEVWFLSANKKAELNQLMNQKSYVLSSKTATLQCQEMGDYCFDPQHGLYKKDDAFAAPVETSKIENVNSKSIPSAQSVDREMIDCDKTNMFDMFCGKAKKEAVKTNAKLDIWIDTSSSMREMDFVDKQGGCYRKSFITRLDSSCPFNEKVNVMMFDTSIKQAGTIDSLCTNQGLNDQKKLIDWIERSDAKKLVIITDIHEFFKDFADYIESKNGNFKGDKDVLTAAQLLDLVDELARSCR